MKHPASILLFIFRQFDQTILEMTKYADISRYIVTPLIGTPFTTLRQLMRRGSVRLLVLKALESRPMHGYDVAKEISRLFEGTYIPSAGVIYPTLRWLEDQAYLKEIQSDERRVYSITNDGRTFLKDHERNLQEIIDFVQRRKNEDEFTILQSASRLQRNIASNLHLMSKSEKVKVARYLDAANEQVEKLVRKR